MNSFITLTKTNCYHTQQSPITVNVANIDSVEWDDDFRMTDVRMLSGKSFSVVEGPKYIAELIG